MDAEQEVMRALSGGRPAAGAGALVGEVEDLRNPFIGARHPPATSSEWTVARQQAFSNRMRR